MQKPWFYCEMEGVSEKEKVAWQQVNSTFELNDFLAYDEGTYFSWVIS